MKINSHLNLNTKCVEVKLYAQSVSRNETAAMVYDNTNNTNYEFMEQVQEWTVDKRVDKSTYLS